MSLKVIIVVLTIASIAHGSIFTSCDVGKLPNDIQIDNCNNKYCVVERGKQTTMKLTFQTVSVATILTAEGRAQFLGMWMSLPLGEWSNVCENCSLKCPIQPNTAAIYTVIVTIPSTAPAGTKTNVECKISDQNKKIVACVRIPVYISA